MKFNYHNMQYPGDSERVFERTRPMDDDLFTSLDEPYFTLEWLYQKYPLRSIREKLTVLDLGSLEGGYAISLARSGFNVTCLEARKENCDKIKWIRDKWGLTNVLVIQGDVKYLDISFRGRQFDIVLCCGILYHLNEPVHFLDTIERSTRKILVVNTHYANIQDSRYEKGAIWTRAQQMLYKRFPAAYDRERHRLSALTTNEGLPGRWLHEYAKNATRAAIEQSAQASYSNSRSFWLSEEALTCVLTAQYDKVEEIYHKKRHDRKIWVCEK